MSITLMVKVQSLLFTLNSRTIFSIITFQTAYYGMNWDSTCLHDWNRFFESFCILKYLIRKNFFLSFSMFNIPMGWCRKDITPLLTHWSYVFPALTHQWNQVTHSLFLQNIQHKYPYSSAMSVRYFLFIMSPKFDLFLPLSLCAAYIIKLFIPMTN